MDMMRISALIVPPPGEILQETQFTAYFWLPPKRMRAVNPQVRRLG